MLLANYMFAQMCLVTLTIFQHPHDIVGSRFVSY